MFEFGGCHVFVFFLFFGGGGATSLFEHTALQEAKKNTCQTNRTCSFELRKMAETCWLSLYTPTHPPLPSAPPPPPPSSGCPPASCGYVSFHSNYPEPNSEWQSSFHPLHFHFPLSLEEKMDAHQSSVFQLPLCLPLGLSFLLIFKLVPLLPIPSPPLSHGGLEQWCGPRMEPPNAKAR